MKPRVTAIVPCYNEAERIGAVLEVLTKTPEIAKVIVVNDGNGDNSAEVIRQYKVQLIQNGKKQGPSEAKKQALQLVDTEVVLLCDADLVGLTPEHVRSMVMPVVENPAVLTVATLDKYWHLGTKAAKKHLMLIPITGTRALRTDVLREASHHKLFSKWGAEAVINMTCRKRGVKLVRVHLDGVKDVMKPFKKNHGIMPHIEETVDITAVYSKLYLGEAKRYVQALPKKVKHKIRHKVLAMLRSF